MAHTELRTEIEIHAPPAVVYRIITDFSRYPEWNPFITAIDGQLAVGERLRLEISLPEGKAYRTKPTLLSVKPGQELRWRERLAFNGLLDSERFFQLHPAGENATRFVQGENIGGVLRRLMNDRLTMTARGFVYMNQALKRRAESMR